MSRRLQVLRGIAAIALVLGTFTVVSLASEDNPATAAASPAAAAAPAQAAPATEKVLNFDGKVVSWDRQEGGKKGEGPLDYWVEADDLLQDGKVVGEDVYFCMSATVDRKKRDAKMCYITIKLADGMITGQNMFDFADTSAKEYVFAVTGGTGAYSKVRGVITSPVTQTEDFTMTLRLTMD